MTAVAIDALLGQFGGRQRRFLGTFLVFVEQAFISRVDIGLRLHIPQLVFGQIFLKARDRIASLPVIDHFLGNVFCGIVLGVAFHAMRFYFDEDRAAAGTALVDGFFRGGINRDNVVAVDNLVSNAVSDGAIREILDGHLPRDRRGIRPLIVF